MSSDQQEQVEIIFEVLGIIYDNKKYPDVQTFIDKYYLKAVEALSDYADFISGV